METLILVDNLKCGGCANTIFKQLKELSGITSVKVFPGKGEVLIGHTDASTLNEAKDKLRALGYPESGTTKGVEKLATSMKSYVSCAVGRFSKTETENGCDT